MPLLRTTPERRNLLWYLLSPTVLEPPSIIGFNCSFMSFRRPWRVWPPFSLVKLDPAFVSIDLFASLRRRHRPGSLAWISSSGGALWRPLLAGRKFLFTWRRCVCVCLPIDYSRAFKVADFLPTVFEPFLVSAFTLILKLGELKLTLLAWPFLSQDS